jgi:predicted small lipoprotein YifL
MNPSRRAIILVLLAASIATLAACGNKGPLVLPDKPDAKTAAPAEQAPPQRR